MTNIEIIKKQNKLIEDLFKLVTGPTVKLAEEVSVIHKEAQVVIDEHTAFNSSDEDEVPEKKETVPEKPKTPVEDKKDPGKKKKRMF